MEVDVEILAHRGAWSTLDEPNSLAALRRAWRSGHGIETDLRDHDGQIVVSHDPPRGAENLLLDDLLQAWCDEGDGTTLALNVKADGLASCVAERLVNHGALANAFVFDMAVPDHLSWLDVGVATCTRASDLEGPALLDRSAGTWWDAFEDDFWWDPQEIVIDLSRGRRATVVSPELHGRDPVMVWERVRQHALHTISGFALCTDRPDDATEFFA